MSSENASIPYLVVSTPGEAQYGRSIERASRVSDKTPQMSSQSFSGGSKFITTPTAMPLGQRDHGCDQLLRYILWFILALSSYRDHYKLVFACISQGALLRHCPFLRYMDLEPPRRSIVPGGSTRFLGLPTSPYQQLFGFTALSSSSGNNRIQVCPQFT